MFRKLFLTAVFAVTVAMVVPTTTKADFILTLTSTQNATTTVGVIDFSDQAKNKNVSGLTITPDGGGAWTVSGKFGGYTVQANSNSFDFGGGTAQVNDSTLQIINNSNSVSGKNKSTLDLNLVQTFTPTIPNVAVTAFQSLSGDHVGTGNGSNVKGTTTFTGLSITTLTPATETMTSPGGPGQGPTSSATVNATSVSITNDVLISGLGIGQYDNFQFLSEIDSVNTPFIQTTPAPAGLILAATMVPFFGLLRRRLSRMAPESPVSA